MRAKGAKKAKIFKFSYVFSQIFWIEPNIQTRAFKIVMLLFLSLTCNFQNGPNSVKFWHLPLAPKMLFDLSNKPILYICHYQTPCRNPKPKPNFIFKKFLPYNRRPKFPFSDPVSAEPKSRNQPNFGRSLRVYRIWAEVLHSTKLLPKFQILMNRK